MGPTLWQACTHVRIEEGRRWWSGYSQSLQGIHVLWGVIWAHIGLETRCQAPERAESGAGELAREQAGQRQSCCLSVSCACWRAPLGEDFWLLWSITWFWSVMDMCGHCMAAPRATEATSQTKPRQGEALQRLWSHIIWSPGLLHPPRVTVHKLLNYSVSQFSHTQNGIIIAPFSNSYCKDAIQ